MTPTSVGIFRVAQKAKSRYVPARVPPFRNIAGIIYLQSVLPRWTLFDAGAVQHFGSRSDVFLLLPHGVPTGTDQERQLEEVHHPVANGSVWIFGVSLCDADRARDRLWYSEVLAVGAVDPERVHDGAVLGLLHQGVWTAEGEVNGQ